MAVGTLSEALDRFYTTTWQNMKTSAVDQIFDATPFWFWMKQGGRLESVEGGRFLSEPLQYAKSERTVFIGRGGTTPMNENEFMTVAIDDWKYLTDTIVRFGVDDQQNRGKNQIISLATAKLENSRLSLEDKMEETLVADNSATPLYFNGLQTIVADDPTASVSVHGINQSTYSWWRNKSSNMTGLSFSVYGLSYMRTLLNNCKQNKNSDAPDIILSGQTPWEYYDDLVIEQKRIVNKTMADAEFENIEYKGIPMVWSPQIANTRMYMLNSRFLRFKYDPMMNFDMTEWKPIPDQVNDRVAQIILAGNLMTSRRRVHGVLYNIDTE